MRLEQLEAFLLVAETGSFQQAAKRRGVTQSTISRQIQSLEAELDAPLFHRTAQVKLTVAGEALLPKARRICQDYPEVQLRVTALGSDRSLKVLRDGLVDVAIVMDNERLTTSPEMSVKTLYEEPVEILMAVNHPLTQFERVPWSALAQYPQVVFKDGYGMQRLVQAQFERGGGELQAALELNTLDAFQGVVRQGKLVALLPQSALTDSRGDPTLTVRQTEAPVLRRRVVLVTTCDRLEIPIIQHFCQLVLERGAIFLPQSPRSSQPLSIENANTP